MTTTQAEPQNRNCLSYWFPLIQAAGLPVPRTEIIETGCRLGELLDGKTPAGFKKFQIMVGIAAERIGYPYFLRTGFTSHKHAWRDTCYVSGRMDLESHIFRLVEFSATCDLLGLPVTVWAVRKLIPTTPAFTAFHGMPIVREFRVFTRDDKAICLHPYWPPEAIRNPSIDDWESRLAAMSKIDRETAAYLRGLAQSAAEATEYGDWSIDFLEDSSGKWWLTDMAEAARSWHWPGCEKT